MEKQSCYLCKHNRLIGIIFTMVCTEDETKRFPIKDDLAKTGCANFSLSKTVRYHEDYLKINYAYEAYLRNTLFKHHSNIGRFPVWQSD